MSRIDNGRMKRWIVEWVKGWIKGWMLFALIHKNLPGLNTVISG